MPDLPEVIADGEDIAEAVNACPEDHVSNLEATVAPVGSPNLIEFHVQMRGHTMTDMEALIVEAAVRQMFSESLRNEIRKKVETALMHRVVAYADGLLERIAVEALDQPVTAAPYSSAAPLTMREIIGLTGREYLTTQVGQDGKPIVDTWGRKNGKPRIVHIVESAMDVKLKKEIEASTSAAVAEARSALKARHEAVLAEELERFRKAMGIAEGAKS